MASNTPAAKTERLMNLVMTLLYTRRPMPKARIREVVEQYKSAPTDEAFDRMFERDKDELRELGIPLVTEEMTAAWDDEPGYRIHQRDYALPQLHFEPDELAVLGLAARAWSHATLAGPAAQALRKLRASGVEPDGDAFIGIEPRLATTEPAFGPILDALQASVPIAFRYLRSGGKQRKLRHVEPWGLAARRGRWYLTGFDTDRQAARVFRLSRIEGAVERDGTPGTVSVPADHDPHAMIATSVAEQPRGAAEVEVRDGAGHGLRRRAASLTAGRAGWSTLTIPYADPTDLAEEVASYGASARVLAPNDIVAAVKDRLTASATAHQRDTTTPATSPATIAATTPAADRSVPMNAEGSR